MIQETKREWEISVDDISHDLKSLPEGKKLVYICRACPMHFGHQAMIGAVSKAQPDNHLILVGSCNQPISYRNLFEFGDRITFIREVFPDLTIAGLPDFRGDNDSWFANLDCMIAITGTHPKDAIFVGGCIEDIAWFRERGRLTWVVNRFSGITMNISGTEIRDHLITGKLDKLEKFLDPRIIPMVAARFKTQWEKLRAQ